MLRFVKVAADYPDPWKPDFSDSIKKGFPGSSYRLTKANIEKGIFRPETGRVGHHKKAHKEPDPCLALEILEARSVRLLDGLWTDIMAYSEHHSRAADPF